MNIGLSTVSTSIKVIVVGVKQEITSISLMCVIITFVMNLSLVIVMTSHVYNISKSIDRNDVTCLGYLKVLIIMMSHV